MGKTPTHNANGHRRRQVVARVKAEETHCALCGNPVDKQLKHLPGEHGKICPTTPCNGCIPHPLSGEVDEDIPRARGGSPYDRANCHLLHRKCNQYKGDQTLSEARAKLSPTLGAASTQPVIASPIW